MITEDELEQFIDYQIDEAQKCAFSIGRNENGNNNKSISGSC